MTDEEMQKVIDQKEWTIKRAYAVLKENFDDVVVLASSTSNEMGTYTVGRHYGNHFACIGMAQAFVRRAIDEVNEKDDYPDEDYGEGV